MAEVNDRRRQHMLTVNHQQQKFYEGRSASSLSSKGNWVTRLWRWARRRQQTMRSAIGLDEILYRQHKEWMGDLTELSVLDLGCYSGNPLSEYLAQNAGNYLAVDLSSTALTEWRSNLDSLGLNDAETLAADVLDPAFLEKYTAKFDLIYAHSVLHHFEYLEVFLQDAEQLLRPGGRIISLDPMEGSGLIRMLRKVYRPFQSDRAWEFPFGSTQLQQIQAHFNIKGVMGLMGNVKWGAPVFLLGPFLGKAIADRLLKRDLKRYSNYGPHLKHCMQISLCLERRS